LIPIITLGWVYNTMFWDSMFSFWHVLVACPAATFLLVVYLTLKYPE
jgi:hypothetical protein